MTGMDKGSRGLWLIAAFKLIKGLALLALGVGALKLLHKDVATEAERWIDLLRIDPQNPYVQKLLEKFGNVDDKKLKLLSLGTFAYAGLFLTEGMGLAFRKRWAEYITIISTASLLPFEVYEIAKHVSAPRIIILLANIAVVVYLIIEVRRTRKPTTAP
jgi:uncharacterized membrane protein (DUF2068 family)